MLDGYINQDFFMGGILHQEDLCVMASYTTNKIPPITITVARISSMSIMTSFLSGYFSNLNF